MTKSKQQSSGTSTFGSLFRFQRSLPAALITGSAAFAGGAGPVLSLWLALAGWCLAAGGFAFDTYMNRVRQQKEQKEKNKDHESQPIPGIIPVLALVFSAACFVILAGLRSFSRYPLVVAAIILILAACLALQVFEKALTRALIMGLLQGLHLVMGWSAGLFSAAAAVLAVALLAATVGARAMIDIRNFPEDLMTRKKTFPKQFNMTNTVKLAIISLIAAYAGVTGAYFLPGFTVLYIIPAALLVGGGVLSIILFVKKAGPASARKLTPFFTVITLILVSLAMILGQL